LRAELAGDLGLWSVRWSTLHDSTAVFVWISAEIEFAEKA